MIVVVRHRIFKWVAVCLLITTSFTCRAQEKNRLVEDYTTYAQQKNFASNVMNAPEADVLNFFHKIDSVADAGQITSYFARLYSISMENIELKLVDADSSTRRFVR